MSNKKKRAALTINNIITWIKSSNPVIEEVRYLIQNIDNGEINRQEVSDDEMDIVKQILNTAITDMESDYPAMHSLAQYDKNETEKPLTTCTSNNDCQLDTSPLIEEIDEVDIIKLSENEKLARFNDLKKQIVTSALQEI